MVLQPSRPAIKWDNSISEETEVVLLRQLSVPTTFQFKDLVAVLFQRDAQPLLSLLGLPPTAPVSKLMSRTVALTRTNRLLRISHHLDR